MKFGLVAFFTYIALAIAKQWLPGMDTALIIAASIPVVGYLMAESKYPTVPRE